MADSMTAELTAFYDRSMTAERSGDVEEALAYHSQRRQWLHWAELVPDPARGRLLRFAEATADVA